MTSFALELHSLLGIAGRSLMFLLLTAGIAFAFRKHSASVVHGVWAVGLGGCLAIPVVMWLSPNWSLPLLPPEITAVQTALDSANASQPVTANDNAARARVGNGLAKAYELTTNARPTVATPPATIHVGDEGEQVLSAVDTSRFGWPSLATMATVTWATGIVAMLLRLLQQTIAVQRRANQARELNSEDWRAQRDVAARLLGLPKSVALKSCPEAISPMVVGLWKPVVLLPGDADTWPNERCQLVLLHELAHIQRYDVLTQTMAALACAVYWFNPLAWWAAMQMKRLREIACDDAVVTHSTIPANYAQTLLDVSKRYRHQPLAP